MATFESQVLAFSERTIEDVKKVREQVQKEVVASVINDTPVDTGRARANWIASKGAPANYGVFLFSPTSNPVAAAQAEAFGEDGKLFFVNNVEYVQYLELGHSGQAPRGMVGRNVTRIANNVRARYG